MTNYTQNFYLIELGCAFSVDISPQSLFIKVFVETVETVRDINASFTPISLKILLLPYVLNAGYSVASLKKKQAL